MKQIDIVIDNPKGLHARPAKYFVKIAKQFQSDIRVLRDDKKANAKSLVSMLKLGVKRGHCIYIQVEGVDEHAAAQALKTAVDQGLGEAEQHVLAPAPQNTGAPVAEMKPCLRDASDGLHIITGIGAAPGKAIGPVRLFKQSPIRIEETFAGSSVEHTRLHQAIHQAREQLKALRRQMGKSAAQEADIFDAHLELLDDLDLLEQVRAGLEDHKSAVQAWQSTIEAHARSITQLDDPLLSARKADLQDIGDRVLRLLVGADEQRLDTLDQPAILIANDLSPSQTAVLDKDKVLGFCTAAGGPTAHSAIIARAMGIPAIVSAGPEVLKIADQTVVILDGGNGTLMIDPDAASISNARASKEQYRRQCRAAEKDAALAAITTNGHRVEIAANIGHLEDAGTAVACGAEGIGLLRTEFLFIGREQAPTEQEQFQAYRQIVQTLQGLPLIIRTLDIGGDKKVQYMTMPLEDNPFLGQRGIRLCLNYPSLLIQQLRAIFRAAAYGPLRILFPMITDLSEWEKVHAVVEAVRIEMNVPPVELGIMIEVPSAALTADALAAHVDFFSIGTNDLTQYTLAIDRMHPTLACRSDGLHPAVLRLIDTTVQAARKHGKWVGVCGELAADPKAIPILVGLGVTELSVTVPAVAGVKAQVRSLALADAQALARKALCCAAAAQVRALNI